MISRMHIPSCVAEAQQEAKDQRRKKLLEAAEAAFAENGIDAATMDEVARKAQLVQCAPELTRRCMANPER